MNDAIYDNSEYYEDLDLNFNEAYKLCKQDFSHDELLNMLKNGNIPQKQIAALKFDYINDTKDAEALITNLTGCDGKIRETVAHKINYFLINDPKTRDVFANISAEIFADATIDINGNICRLIVDSAFLLKDYEQFAKTYTKKIVQFANDALTELDKFIFRDKKYVINKQNFKLYWCLDALSGFYDYENEQTISELLKKCAVQNEYTIREKTAQIVIKSGKFDNIKEMLINDENYYVRQALHH